MGEELTGMESVKLYIRLSLICRALGGGLRVGSHPRSSTQSGADSLEGQFNETLLCYVAEIAWTAELEEDPH